MPDKIDCCPDFIVSSGRVMRSAALCILVLPVAGHAGAMELEAFVDLAHRCGPTVAASTLAAVAKTESGFETLTVSDNTTGKSHIYKTLDETASAAEHLMAKGDSIDIGLMQINSANLKGLGMTVRDALDSCKSISAAATILTRNYLDVRNAPNEQAALRDAISQYNTGNRADGYRNGYVRKVEQAARTLPVPDLTGDGAQDEAANVSDGEDLNSGPWDVWRQEERSPVAVTVVTKSNSIKIF